MPGASDRPRHPFGRKKITLLGIQTYAFLTESVADTPLMLHSLV